MLIKPINTHHHYLSFSEIFDEKLFPQVDVIDATNQYDFEACQQNFAFNMLAFDDNLYFDVQIKKGSWFGFGFGETMTDCDMVVFECN